MAQVVGGGVGLPAHIRIGIGQPRLLARKADGVLEVADAVDQPGLAGLMDGSVSTLAPLFAAAFATGNTGETFKVGLAASVGAGISMGFAEALSDDGSLTGRGTPWMRRLGDFSDAFASGTMRVRGVRRQRNVDRGIVLSDHADWPALRRGPLFVFRGAKNEKWGG